MHCERPTPSEFPPPCTTPPSLVRAGAPGRRGSCATPAVKQDRGSPKSSTATDDSSGCSITNKASWNFLRSPAAHSSKAYRSPFNSDSFQGASPLSRRITRSQSVPIIIAKSRCDAPISNRSARSVLAADTCLTERSGFFFTVFHPMEPHSLVPVKVFLQLFFAP